MMSEQEDDGSGWVTVIGRCLGCGGIFGFHPHRVPSIVVENGAREPICESCYRLLQQRQREAGYPVSPDPLPGAYDGCPASELGE